jgi:hypothetical protein
MNLLKGKRPFSSFSSGPSDTRKDVVEKLKYRSKAPTTREAYDGAWNRFKIWANSNGFPSLPSSTDAVAEYLADMVMLGKGIASANMALAAITDKHRMAKLANPCKDEYGTIALVMEGIKRECGKPSVQAEGLSKACWKGMVNVAIGQHLDGKGKASLVMWREAWR